MMPKEIEIAAFDLRVGDYVPVWGCYTLVEGLKGVYERGKGLCLLVTTHAGRYFIPIVKRITILRNEFPYPFNRV